jgi:dipeptidyl aminopeptidase/acylaminoacyl peptidase
MTRLIFRVSLAIVAAVAPLAAGFAAEPPVAPLPVETVLDALAFGQYAPVDLSPDGRWVAFTVLDRRRVATDPDPRYHAFNRNGTSMFGVGCDVWIANTQTGASRNLTEGRGNSYYPVWSPDGRFLAFYSDREDTVGLWLWEQSTGAFRRASDRIVRAFGGQVAAWTPDSRRVIFSALPEEMSIEEAAELFVTTTESEEEKPSSDGPKVTVFDSREEKQKASTWSMKSHVGDLVVVDVAGGNARTLTRSLRPHWWGISPDGSRVAITSGKGYEPGGDFQALFDLMILELDGGRLRTVSSDIRQEAGNEVSWAPDGKSLAYLTGGYSKEGKRGDCFWVSARGGAPRLLTPGSHPAFSEDFRQPLWEASGESVYLFGDDGLWKAPVSGAGSKLVAKIPQRKILEVLAPGGRAGRLWSTDGGRSATLLARDEESKRVGVYRVDLSSGTVSALSDEESSYGHYTIGLNVDASADGKTIVFLRQDSRHPPDLWLSGAELRDAKRLTRLNPDFDRYRMGGVRLVDWKSPDGETLRGALVLPAGYEQGQRVPLIVYPYGGASRSNNLFEFGLAGTGTENMQLLATRGYAVLLPDSKVRLGTPMRDIAGSVLSGVARLIELGIGDPDRIGVTGHSYGGYSVLSILVQSKLFKAAVARAGIYSLTGSYGDMGRDGTALNVQWVEAGQGIMGGTPWEFRSRYIENSPWFYLDRVETPLLIVHGSEDARVPAYHASSLFVALRRLGKPVVYARYEGEDHSELYWSYANQLDYSKRVLAWFDEHLKKPKAEESKKKEKE